MKPIAPLLTSLLLAGWAIAMAILSVQNATPVFLKFFNFQSIQMPVGVVLAMSAGVGIIGGATAQLFWHNQDRLPRSENKRAAPYQVSLEEEEW